MVYARHNSLVMLSFVTRISRSFSIFSVAICCCIAGCSTSSPVQNAQTVVQNAQTALQAKQQQAKAAAQGREREREQLEKIPPPTKSQYVDVHTTENWENPFLSVGSNTIKIRVIMPDANPSQIGQGGLLRPANARRQELEVRVADLPEALTSLPEKAWPYGRVVAVAEGFTTERKLRPQIRRNVEATIQILNDLGIVVDEWPAK
jgi:hypothetical protein